jgi:hypothetical protein
MDPDAKIGIVAFSTGTAQATIGLLKFLFGVESPSWNASSGVPTERGRRRYRYGTRQRSNAAAGKQVILELADGGAYSVRVTGPIVDFISEVVSRSEDRVVRAYTRRGTVYAPAFEPLS